MQNFLNELAKFVAITAVLWLALGTVFAVSSQVHRGEMQIAQIITDAN